MRFPSPGPAWAKPDAVEARRVFAFFGAPGVGTSTLVRAFYEEGGPIGVVRAGEMEAEEVVAAVEKVRKGKEACFLDGAPRNVEEVQLIYDERLIAPGWGGAFIRVHRNNVLYNSAYNRVLAAIEERIRLLSAPYFVVHADDPNAAMQQIIKRTNL